MEITLASNQPGIRKKETAGLFMKNFVVVAEMRDPKVIITKISRKGFDEDGRIGSGQMKVGLFGDDNFAIHHLLLMERLVIHWTPG